MDEAAFLRTIMVSPEDQTTRSVYADWLEERGDPRTSILRITWQPRIRYADWLAKDRNLDAYLNEYPELHEEVRESQTEKSLTDQLATVRKRAEPEWLAFMDTLGSPFQPFFFWNNTGPRSYEAGELPFTEQIGTRGMVITFQSAFRDKRAWRPGLLDDLAFLRQLRLRVCYYGAASCPVHPFICEVKSRGRRLSGTTVINALKAKEFRSEHIQTLDATAIPFPGYHPGTDNDEIHNDFAEQHMFPRSGHTWSSEGEDETQEPQPGDETYEALRNYVADGQLWYVALHSLKKNPADEMIMTRHSWVLLFAVGLSPHRHRLLGLVSHQVCHNLCD